LSRKARPSVLLTGANGFVGRKLAPRLAAFAGEGAKLTALGRKDAPEGWTFAEADIVDLDAVTRIVREAQPDFVVHLAAQSSVGAAEKEETWRVNAFGSLALAAACARESPDAIVLCVSSAEVYGASFRNGPVDEDAPMMPMNAYARSKAAAEAIFADVLAPTVRLIVARAFNHTGAGQDVRFVLPSFARQIAEIETGLREPVVRVGNLDAERDFLHIDDVCRAYIALLHAAPRLPMRNVFNVASGISRPIRAYLECMRAHARAPFAIEVDPARLRPSDVPIARGNSERLRHLTGWSPTYSLEFLVQELLMAGRTEISRKPL
jgi:GDP-4-dehydro-6-deoxy-D-mannose reductase